MDVQESMYININVQIKYRTNIHQFFFLGGQIKCIIIDKIPIVFMKIVPKRKVFILKKYMVNLLIGKLSKKKLL